MSPRLPPVARGVVSSRLLLSGLAPLRAARPKCLTKGFEKIRHSFYSLDGRSICAQASHRSIFRLPASGGEMKPVTTFPGSGLFMEKPTLSPDGRSLADCRWNGGSSLWLLSIDHDRSQAP